MRKLLVVLTAVALCFAAISACVAQKAQQSVSIQNITRDARIDWTNLVYVVEGQGALPNADKVPNRALALLKAKDYAKMDAIANLRMAIEGTTISYEATGKDYMADVTIRQKIEGFVKNAEVVNYRTEKFEGDTIVTVKMKAPMFGQNAPGALFLSEPVISETKTTETNGNGVSVEASLKVVLKPDRKDAPKPPSPVKAIDIDPNAPDVMAAAKPSLASKPYTGVIFDAMGYNLKRAMSPAIRRTDGSLVWDGSAASPEVVVNRGIVAYATSITSARQNKRVGSNPLIIRCVGRAGGSFSCDPVISDGDAEILLYENTKGRFLDDSNIVIVKDPVFK